jgi:hypothetical protein
LDIIVCELAGDLSDISRSLPEVVSNPYKLPGVGHQSQIVKPAFTTRRIGNSGANVSRIVKAISASLQAGMSSRSP